MALNPVARSSRAEMCSHWTWAGSSSQYQNRPWQYPPMPGGRESVAASAKAATMCGYGVRGERRAGMATSKGAPPHSPASRSCSRIWAAADGPRVTMLWRSWWEDCSL
eukprot:1631919-Pleurochrysis_carterae.AAC.1